MIASRVIIHFKIKLYEPQSLIKGDCCLILFMLQRIQNNRFMSELFDFFAYGGDQSAAYQGMISNGRDTVRE